MTLVVIKASTSSQVKTLILVNNSINSVIDVGLVIFSLATDNAALIKLGFN